MTHKGRSSSDYASCQAPLHWFRMEEGRRTNRCDSLDEFAVVTAGELMQQPKPPEWHLRDSEYKFRRGFYHGYVEAAEHAGYLKRKGFLRVAEVVNLLHDFAENRLRGWFKHTFRDDFTAGTYSYGGYPKLKHEAWAELRRQTFDRDGKRCVRCDSANRLEADHIVPVCQGGLPDLDNLQTLCKTCHRGAREDAT